MVNENIRLYAFPTLARERIFKQMDGFSIFDLLQLSNKIKRVFKRDCRSMNQKIAIIFGENMSISFLSQPNNEDIGTIQILSENELTGNDYGYYQRIGDGEVFSIRSDTNIPILNMFWEDPLMGLQIVCEELINIFHTPTFYIKVDLDEYKETYEPIIFWINRISTMVEDIKFTGFQVDSKVLTWILENLKTNNSVTVSTFLSQYHMPYHLHSHVGKLTISDGKWVKLSHLESMKCEEVRLKKVSLSDPVVNQFLHCLNRGSNQSLKLLALEIVGNVAIDVIISGLNANKIENGKWQFVLSTGDKCFLTCFMEANAYPYGRPDTQIEINIERK